MKTAAQVEARVLELVDTVLGGGKVEDDYVECKADWPGIEKVRQLAGSANSARGALLLLIVGLDETAGRVVAVSDVDPADWWAKVSSKFDEGVAPNLEWHLRVPVGDGLAVTALVFGTERAPYVVKVSGGGSPEREVPVRDGTRTRSAKRDELLRMMSPVSQLPDLDVLRADLTASWNAARDLPDGSGCQLESVSLWGAIHVYIGHLGRDVAILPVHLMSGELRFGQTSIRLAFSIWGDDLAKKPPPQWGVSSSSDQLTCTASGRAVIRFRAELDGSVRDLVTGTNLVAFRANIGVVGGPRAIPIEVSLSKRNDREAGSALSRRIGQWFYDVEV